MVYMVYMVYLTYDYIFLLGLWQKLMVIEDSIKNHTLR